MTLADNHSLICQISIAASYHNLSADNLPIKGMIKQRQPFDSTFNVLFNFIRNATFIMINQLLYSSEHQRRRKKVDRWGNLVPRPQQTQQPLAFLEEQQSQSLFHSPMSTNIVYLTPQEPPFRIQEDFQSIQNSIRSKLKLKKVYLPKIDQDGYKVKSLSPQPRSYEISRNNLAKSTIKSRLRTESYEQREDSDQEERVCDKTLIQICELNKRFQKYNRRRNQRSQQKFNPFGRNDERDSSREERVRFNHPSRQQEFQQYVKHLEKKHQGKMFQRNGLKGFEGPSMGVSRNSASKYNYQQEVNPESAYNQRQMRLANLPNYRNNLQQNKAKEIVSEVDRQKTQKEQEKLSQMKKRRQLNDKFIKLLRKVNNRGESLLIKLQKYPSRKLLPK